MPKGCIRYLLMGNFFIKLVKTIIKANHNNTTNQTKQQLFLIILIRITLVLICTSPIHSTLLKMISFLARSNVWDYICTWKSTVKLVSCGTILTLVMKYNINSGQNDLSQFYVMCFQRHAGISLIGAVRGCFVADKSFSPVSFDPGT